MKRLAFAIALVLTGCQGAEECKSWTGGNGLSSWGSCGDKKERKIQCDPQPPSSPSAATKCTCTVDGIVGKTFQTTDPIKLGTMETATSIANEQCGWHLSR